MQIFWKKDRAIRGLLVHQIASFPQMMTRPSLLNIIAVAARLSSSVD